MERAEADAVFDAGRDVCVRFILDLAGRVERLEDRLGRLEEQSRQSSRNSSKPPSHDPPMTRQQRRAEARAKTKELLLGERRAGGQPGHRGAGRQLRPEDQVDEIVDHFPDACRGCSRQFSGSERKPGRRFGRHQVAELPPISVVVVEHRTHRLRCPDCRARTTAGLPDGVGRSAFGPRLHAAVVTLTARNRISRRDMSELASELFGIGLSVGAIDALCQRASDVLELPHEQLTASVLCSPAVNVDETGWSTWGEQRTLWTATTPHAAVFRVADDRHRDRLEELISKDFPGIVCSDRWWAYQHLDPNYRQVCWEHLKRDSRRHSEGFREQKSFGEQGLGLTIRLFSAWRTFTEHQDRRRLRRELKPIQRELRTLLERAGRKPTHTREHCVFANKLINIWPALWTFATTEGVQPTNNAAERSLRRPVIHRKLSHRTRSHDGERFIERALSAPVTCRLQHRSLFAYLTNLLTAHNHGHAPPTLT